MDYSKIESVKELEKVLPQLSDAYFNDEPIVSDYVFDNLVEKLKKLKPDSLVLKKIGAPIRDDKKKVKLPYWMGGMDKMKPATTAMRLFFSKNKAPYFLSDKIDGAACLLTYSDGKLNGIYSRGESDYGQDLIFLKNYLKIPKKVNIKEDFYVKGELNVTKKDYQEKFTEEATKARGVVTGVYNSLEPNIETLQALVFSAYETNIKNKDKKVIKPSEQFKILESMKFKTPYHRLLNLKESSMITEFLEPYLNQRKSKSIFEIDGIIVASDYPYEQLKIDNPKHAIAFKVNEEGIETKVLSVSWEATKHGVLFPTIQIESVVIEGDTIKNVSGKNANFILNHNIGKGAIISVIKSGGVIPEIIEVIKGVKAVLPKEDFYWDETHINIVLKNPYSNLDVVLKRLLHFFTSLDIKGIKLGTITKLYNAGLDTIDKICQASVDDFTKAQGIKIKSAEKLHKSIHSVIDGEINLEKLMFASLIFDKGLGTKKLLLILKSYPKIYNFEEVTSDEIMIVEGMGSVSTKGFLEGYKPFKNFMKKHNYLKFKAYKKPNLTKGKYSSEFVVFSGFRDAKLEKKLEEQGAKIEKNITKNTTILVVKNMEKTTSKIEKAKEKNIKILTIKDI